MKSSAHQVMPDGTTVVTTQEAARLLGLSANHVAWMVRKGRWPSVEGPFGYGGRPRRMVPLDEVERLADERRLELASEPPPPPYLEEPDASRSVERLAAARRILLSVTQEEGRTDAPQRWTWSRRRRDELRLARLEQALGDALAASGGSPTSE